MQMAPHIEALQSDLAEIAALGDEATGQAAQRLAAALRSSVGIRILDALTEAALELSSMIPAGHVEVRLAGQDPTLVFVAEQEAETAVAEDDQSARITLRLPESLKARLDAAAAREGVSVNTWLVRALSRAVSSARPSMRVGNRLTGFGRS
jgi:predicted DNA binding CopG/RHH family protein